MRYLLSRSSVILLIALYDRGCQTPRIGFKNMENVRKLQRC